MRIGKRCLRGVLYSRIRYSLTHFSIGVINSLVHKVGLDKEGEEWVEGLCPIVLALKIPEHEYVDVNFSWQWWSYSARDVCEQ